MLTLVMSLCGLALIVLAIVVVYSNHKDATNRWLGAFAMSGLLWLIANLIANQQTSVSGNLLFSRLALIGASLLPLTYVFFCASFTKRNYTIDQKIYFCAPVALLLISVPTSFNIISVTPGSLVINPGLSYLVLIAVIVIYFYQGIRQLILEYRQAKSKRRQQLYYVLLGTLFTLIPALLLSGVLPLLGYSQAAPLGPVASLFFVAFTAISIIKHRLFDIRLIIARSLAYIGSLAVFALIYGIVVLGLARLIFGLHFTIVTEIYLSGVTGLAALSFVSLKKTFDKITNRLFYRDAYEPQAFIDELNRTIIDNIELGILLRRTASVIIQNLKCEFVVFAIFDEANDRMRFIDDTGVAKIPNFSDISRLARTMQTKILSHDDFEYSGRNSDFKNTMSDYNISIIAKLTENLSNKRNGNLLLIGPKKSGNSYNSQDLRIIEIVTNELVIAIQNALRFEEIQKFNSTLQERIDQATRKLRAVNEKLKTLDEAKDDFISMASHQLRTPLTSVKGYISMVVEGDTGEITEQQHKLLAQAYSSSQRMVYIIADLLNVSRLRTGKFIMEPSPINLADVVEEEINLLNETAESHDLTLEYDKPSDFPILMIDETKTRQVIMNYIDNAIYYTPAHGKIWISLEDKNSTIEFRVRDNGIGVPASEKHHLFSKFYRAGNARKARPDGTGLGLFMAKKVIIAQGGAVIFDSTEGKGSTFGFILSKAKLKHQ